MINYNLSAEAIATIKQSEGATLPNIIKKVIQSNQLDDQRMKTLWSEYLGNVPIKSGNKSTNPARPENRLSFDFRGTITQQIVGYMFGIPIDVELPEGESTNDELAEELIDEFLQKNFYSKLDAELETYLSVCGKGFRLLYYVDKLDINGNKITELVMKNIKPWEAVVVNDLTLEEPQYGLIYYQVELDSMAKKFRTRCEFYDDQNVYFFLEDESGNFVRDTTFGEAVQQHGFNYIPLIQFNNNTTLIGDWEKARNLIDGYDKLVSFALTDQESWSNAYLLFFGVEPTEETILAARKTGAFYVPKDNEADQNNDIKFLTKDINTANIKDLAKLLNDNIYRFCAGIDIADETFGGNQSGESRKYKLIPLENKAMEKERLYTEAYQRLFRCACTYWKLTKGIIINYEKIEFIFIRSLPLSISVQELIQLQQAGIISTETAIRNLTFIEDASSELELVTKEKQTSGAMFNLENFSAVTGSNE